MAAVASEAVRGIMHMDNRVKFKKIKKKMDNRVIKVTDFKFKVI